MNDSIVAKTETENISSRGYKLASLVEAKMYIL